MCVSVFVGISRSPPGTFVAFFVFLHQSFMIFLSSQHIGIYLRSKFLYKHMERARVGKM